MSLEILYAHAIKLLSKREHAPSELRNKLMMKHPLLDASDIDTLLSKLITEGLLSEDRYTEAYITSCIGRGIGPVRIFIDLKEREVAKDIIEKYLNSNDDGWINRCGEVRRKKFGDEIPKALKGIDQQVRYLSMRGFSGKHINRIFPEAIHEEVDEF